MMNKSLLHYGIFIGVLAALLLSTTSAFAKITFAVDRTDIHEHETFHLRVQVEESNTLREGAAVDFIPEEITIRSRQEYNNSIIVNGQYDTKLGWDFELLAEESGTYTIPALTIGKERSEPFTLRILPQEDDLEAAGNSKIKLRANVSEEEVYVQQQLVFTIRIYRSVVARSQQITPIRVSNAVVEQLGENKTFDVVKGGNSFRVVEQRFAIFPQQSGDMTIEPMTYSATILEDNKGRSPWKRSQLKPISLSTQKYTIKVKPKPKNAAEPWLPASNIQLESEWQPANQTFTVGTPANFDFIIKGTGLLKTQLPTVTFPEQEGITIYRDSPQYRQIYNRFGVNSYHLEKIAVIPSLSGDITVPEVKIPWWNVKTDQQEYAILPAKTFYVEPSSKQIAKNTEQTVVPESQTSTNQQPDTVSGNNVNTPSSSTQNYWKYLSLVLAVFWLLTVLLLLKRNKNSKAADSSQSRDLQSTVEQSATDKKPSGHLKNIQVAAHQNNYKATAHSIIAWAKQQPSLGTITNLGQLVDRCQHDDEQAELGDELEKLQVSLYSSESNKTPINGKKLVSLLPKLSKSLNSQSPKTLPGLYEKR